MGVDMWNIEEIILGSLGILGIMWYSYPMYKSTVITVVDNIPACIGDISMYGVDIKCSKCRYRVRCYDMAYPRD